METALDFRPYQVAIVVGIDHNMQHFVQDIAPSDPRNRLRLRYLDFLRDITRRYPVDVISEQAKHGEESIAETVADREALRYRNIEMPIQRRAEVGMPLNYGINTLVLEVSPEQQAKWTASLESYMIDQLPEAIVGARAAVVICGVDHVPALAQALRTKFTRVEHHDVTAMPWFDRLLL